MRHSALGEPDGEFLGDNRDLQKISLRGKMSRMSLLVNELQ
jgi:hypothetical protein